MGGLGISWETRTYLKVGPSQHTWLEIYAFSAEGSFIMLKKTWRDVNYAAIFSCVENGGGLSQCSENKKQMKKNEALMSNIIRCFIAGPEFWEECTTCEWYSIGCTSVYLSPTQYFITFGVNRLSGDDGRCVLTIRQSTYSKRPALLSDIKYWFAEIDLNSGPIKRILRGNQSSG